MRVAAREGGNSSRAELMASPWNKGNGRWKSDAIMIGRISGTGLPFVCQVTFEKKRAHCLPLTSALQPSPPDFCVGFFFLSLSSPNRKSAGVWLFVGLILRGKTGRHFSERDGRELVDRPEPRTVEERRRRRQRNVKFKSLKAQKEGRHRENSEEYWRKHSTLWLGFPLR